ncbi:hypothetical protein [Paenibacillus ginsengarvi]|uniref:Bacteriophage SP-beta YorD domain-containing protein n=1 Tax=Paenibacillus ginsengarvi TaxID=400777 RepID=A0A3B0CSM2_9BACL|nr:hypothetical protein [Paenibacillus ginsengarvi]RKN85876.1 hypothetical protein D7M11_05950 [Paenibacillus ginsengarvi]
MKEAIKVDLNGYYIEPELVPLSEYDVTPIFKQPALEEERLVKLDLVPIGYRVAIPVPPGLFKPRFDLETWASYSASKEYQRDEYGQLMLDGNDQPIPLPHPDVQFWTEGLTQEEIEALRNIPQPETDAQKIARLEQDKAALEQRLQAAEGAILFLLDKD